MIGLSNNRLEEGRWSSGRPIFKKVDGETRFLLVKEGTTVWSIDDSTTDTGSWIQSGRATNSPSSPEAGPNVRLGVTRWQYGDNGKWKEGNISVKCEWSACSENNGTRTRSRDVIQQPMHNGIPCSNLNETNNCPGVN